MAKKTETQREVPAAEKGRLVVVGSKGVRQRFLRGMITHDLTQRGVDFADAFATANAIRDQLDDRHEVTTAEIRELVREELTSRLGKDQVPDLRAPVRPIAEHHVVYHGHEQPFSRGLLARSIQAAGIDLDHAYRLVTKLESGLREDDLKVLPSAELARRVGDLLERLEGPNAARRYRLMRRIRGLPRPLILYVGGASGTGKSTLSLELAPMLRIYRINATDTIRQVMRMVFSREIMPALYSSSFEVAPPFGPQRPEERPASSRDPEFRERLVASFEDQGRRVAVGVRAVVERAIAENMSIIVEGVHLYPPLVPFADLEGAAYQVPLMLITPDREVHRSRFLGRARFGPRRAERYVENFSAIRLLHDFLHQRAEAHDVAVIATSYGDPPVVESLHEVTSQLEKRLPALAQPPGKAAAVAPVLLLIVDGLADRPVRALGGRTPLQAARTPTLDRLATEGRCGLVDPVAPGVVPDTASGTLAIFGQSPSAMKRGPVEALGAGLKMAPGDVALRANLATLDDAGQVTDRRAGRIREQAPVLARALDRLPLPGSLAHDVEVRVKAATEHRLAIVLRGEGLSSRIQGSDPGDGAAPGPPLTPRPTDPHDERAVFTAGALALFEQEARKVLAEHPVNAERQEAGLPPANAVLTRGAGSLHRLVPLEEAGLPLRVVCIGGDRTVLGLAGWLGAEVISRKGMTANLDSDLGAKFEAARDGLKRGHDLVIIHFKGADIAAHDRRPELKVSFLEKVDRFLGEFLDHHSEPLRIAVASDHVTLSESGQHAADPIPVLIWGQGIEADQVRRFDEQSAAAGGLQRFPLQMLLGRLFELS